MSELMWLEGKKREGIGRLREQFIYIATCIHAALCSLHSVELDISPHPMRDAKIIHWWPLSAPILYEPTNWRKDETDNK
jgi:hypothetical protein